MIEDRELEIPIVCVKLGLSFSSVRRLMDSNELRWTTRGPKKGYRIFESSVDEYKKKRDAMSQGMGHMDDQVQSRRLGSSTCPHATLPER